MVEQTTPEAPPESSENASPGTNRLPDASNGTKSPGTNRLPKTPDAKKAPWYAPEAKGGDGATTEISDTQRRQYAKSLYRDKGETPWQHAREWTRQPLKTGTKVGLFALNPVVYSSVYAADWLANRTPGVKNLYAKPREIIRDTADKTMNTVNAGVTFLPSLPSTVAHEIHDAASGMDVSKPTNLIGKLIDKVGDFVHFGFKLTKFTTEKVIELAKKVGVPTMNVIGTAIAAPFKAVFGTIGAAYGGFSRMGGITGALGQLALTGALVIGGNAAITASLGAFAPAALPVYQGIVETIKQTVTGMFSGGA